LTSMGKIIGGGFPVGALAGTDEFMSCLDPTRDRIPFPYSGTFSANPITMTAGRVAMEYFDKAAVTEINRLGEYTRQQLSAAIKSAGVKACVTGAGSLFRVHLKEHPPVEYRTAYQDADEAQQIARLVDYLYKNGFMVINTCSGALSTAITESEIDQLAATLEAGLQEIV